MVLQAPATLADGALRLGTNVWPGYEPLYLARSLGYLDQSKVRLIEFPSASEVIRAFRNGTLEIAALTLDEALLLRQGEVPAQVFLITDISDGGDVIVGRPGLTGVESLAGARVGVEGNALGAYVLMRALDLHRVPLDRVEIVQLEVHEHVDAFERGEVDAVVTFEPVRTHLLKRGAKELFSSREIPGEIVDVLVARAGTADRHSGAIEHLVRGWFRALEFLKAQPNEAATLMSERLRLEPADVLRSFDGLRLPGPAENVDMLGAPGATLLPVARRLGDVMLKQELLAAPMALDGLLAPAAVKSFAR